MRTTPRASTRWREMADLERPAESGAEVSTEKDGGLRRDQEVKHALVSERDDQVTQIVSLRDEGLRWQPSSDAFFPALWRRGATRDTLTPSSAARRIGERDAREGAFGLGALVDLKHELSDLKER